MKKKEGKGENGHEVVRPRCKIWPGCSFRRCEALLADLLRESRGRRKWRLHMHARFIFQRENEQPRPPRRSLASRPSSRWIDQPRALNTTLSTVSSWFLARGKPSSWVILIARFDAGHAEVQILPELFCGRENIQPRFCLSLRYAVPRLKTVDEEGDVAQFRFVKRANRIRFRGPLRENERWNHARRVILSRLELERGKETYKAVEPKNLATFNGVVKRRKIRKESRGIHDRWIVVLCPLGTFCNVIHIPAAPPLIDQYRIKSGLINVLAKSNRKQSYHIGKLTEKFISVRNFPTLSGINRKY